MQQFCLLGLEQVGVIVQLKSGTLFWTLSGQSALRLEQEGVFVPISNDPMVDYPELAMLPRLSRLGGSGAAVSGVHLDEIDALLLEVSSSDQFKVDRNRLQESRLGWVPVIIDAQGDFSYFHSSGLISAVLVWPVKS